MQKFSRIFEDKPKIDFPKIKEVGLSNLLISIAWF